MSVNEMVDRLRWQAPSISFCGEAADMLAELREENERLSEALRGLIWLAEPHFSDKVQLNQLAFCRAALEPRK
jgi:hypothetical protein